MEQTNLFEIETVNHYIGRINSLNHTSAAQWGKMNVAQMLLHCQKPFLIANGTLFIKPNKIIKFLFGKRAKKQLLSGEPFKKNLPTFPEAIISDKREFEKEKKALIETIQAFHKNGEAGLSKNEHPFFGEMTTSSWNILLSQHLNHHLTQFGA